ncbi:hypothetical protein SAPIO_CDS5104 [Scedosporium apiospermum]|uniref:Uncharacterized protein n=1 Tax=Pseudallescheria apiosperma TaxID=563466 RepID=A0A084G6R8_PSEDA|nr:uncharacterized protein SAPIO_CDS5104 [Scedosporium apiospermum]KEZ43030.1 hypothetical protein SAPIO_CDS5104 [Scedosporium apiospermum]
MVGKKKITTLVDQLKHAGAKKKLGLDIAKELLLEGVREIPAVFQYMNDETFKSVFGTINLLRNEATLAEHIWGLAGLRDLWDEFECDVFTHYASKAKLHYGIIIDQVGSIDGDTV